MNLCIHPSHANSPLPSAYLYILHTVGSSQKLSRNVTPTIYPSCTHKRMDSGISFFVLPISKHPSFLMHDSFLGYCTVNGKVHPKTGHKGPEGEQRYSSTLYLTSALEGGGWSTPRPGRFIPGKETRYPLYRRLGGPQGRSGRVRKISLPPGFDPRTLLASRYTD